VSNCFFKQDVLREKIRKASGCRRGRTHYLQRSSEAGKAKEAEAMPRSPQRNLSFLRRTLRLASGVIAALAVAAATGIAADFNPDENTAGLRNHLKALDKAVGDIGAVCSRIPRENQEYFAVNTARDFVAKILVRLRYETELFEVVGLIDSSKKTSYIDKRLGDYRSARNVLFTAVEELREMQGYIVDDIALYHIDTAIEKTLSMLELMDQRAYYLSDQL
jgi:hypothetical protein